MHHHCRVRGDRVGIVPANTALEQHRLVRAHRRGRLFHVQLQQMKAVPAVRSLHALDALNFFLADVREGIGPFLAVYLAATLHWNPAQIGLAIALGGIAGVLAQTPMGALADHLRQKRLLIVIASAVIALGVVLFHFANAAMLPLVGQFLAAGKMRGATLDMAACIIVAQLVMTPVALLAGRLAHTWRRKPVFLIGFLALPIRGALYTLSHDPRYLVAVQALDGIGAGIFGVVSVIVIADLTRGTGRFNLAQGATATATGIGAALSNALTGVVVENFGFNTGFLFLAVIAAVAVVFFAFAMPETNSRAIISGARFLSPLRFRLAKRVRPVC